MKGFLIKVKQDFFSIFKEHVIPEGDVTCPSCSGIGAEDVFINCEYCGGYGHVSAAEADIYKHKKAINS